MSVLLPHEATLFDRGGWSDVARRRAAALTLGGTDSPWIAALVGGGNRDAFDKPFLKSPWVYGCVHTIAQNLGTVPIRVYRGDETKPAAVTAGPLVELMRSPCVGMPRSDFAYRLAMWLGLRGEFFLAPYVGGKPLDRPRLPEALYVVPPTSVQHVADSSGGRIARWEVTGGSSSRLTFTPDVLIHGAYPNPYDRFRGMSPAEVAYAAADSAYQASIFNAEFLKNNGFVGGVLSYDRPLTKPQREQNEKAFDERHAGATKAGNTLFLDHGAKFTPNTVTHRDAQFLEGMGFSRETICAVYGVPPTVLSSASANYATKRSDDRCLWERGIKPVGTRICEYLNIWLGLAGVSEWLAFDWSGVEALQDDLDTSLGRAEKLTKLGYTSDEVNERLRLGMPTGATWRREAWTTPTVVPFGSLVATETDTGVDPATAGAAPVQDTAMNGAQVASLAAIVKDVAAGALPEESAVAMVLAAFPAIPEAQAKQMIGPAAKASAKPKEAQASPVPPQAPPPAAPKGEAPPPQGEPRGAPAVHVRRAKSEALAASDQFARRVVAPAERKLLRVGVSFLASCKRDALAVFDTRGFVAADLELIAKLRAQWDARIRAMYAPPMVATVDSAVKATRDEIGAAFDFDLNDPRWVSSVRDRVDKLTSVNETTIERARSALVKGIAEGVGTPDLRRALEEVFDGDRSRALLIARTEVGSIASSARDESYVEAGIERVQWLTASDDVVRESHAQVDEEIVDRGQRFSNGMHYPHDPSADADEVCNCRCDHVAVI